MSRQDEQCTSKDTDSESSAVVDSVNRLVCEIESALANVKVPNDCGALGSGYNGDLDDLSAIKLHELYSKRMDDLQKLENDYELLSELLVGVTSERDAVLKKLETLGIEHASKVQQYENRITDDQNQIRCLRDRIVAQEAQFHRLLCEKEAQYTTQLDKLTRSLEVAQREKDTAVVRYAQRERDILILEAANQKATKEIKNLQSDRDVLRSHIVTAKGERDALVKVCERKDTDLAWYKREVDRVKSALTDSEESLKAANEKVNRLEEVQTTALAQLENLKAKFQSDAETEVTMNGCSTGCPAEPSSSEMAAQVSHDHPEKVSIAERRLAEMEARISWFENSLLEKTSLANDLQSLVEQLREELAEANRTMSQMEVVKCEAETDKAQAELEASRCREETERLLKLVEKLTDSHTELKTENLSLLSEVEAMRSADDSLADAVSRLRMSLKMSEEKLQGIQEDANKEVAALQEQLRQVTQSERELKTRLEDELNAIKVLKRKQAAGVKELRGEIVILRKRLEQYESSNASQGSSGGSAPDCCSSRAPSPSLDGNTECPKSHGAGAAEVVCEHNQLMIEKIVKLQRAVARRNEKIEFLQESVKHLSLECCKKTKIIQSYVVREETGALAKDDVDFNKLLELLDQANVARRGSTVMSNLFGSGVSNKEMSFELAVEMMRKFQAVLEDVLLKNIMLKENIQTLGQEISRLSRENREIQLRLVGAGVATS